MSAENMERNLDLSSRNEETRENYDPLTVRFNLNEIYEHFNENINAIKKQTDVVKKMKDGNNFTEADDIMRSQIVFLGSSLDFYMHELTKYGLCQIYDEIWSPTQKYYNIEIKMKILESPLKNSMTSDWFLDCVNELYSSVTMISYNSVKDQINLLGFEIDVIADKAFYQQDATEKTKDKLKRILNTLFARRNVIAHQYDRNHYNAEVNEISEEVVENLIDNVVKIVNSIHTYATNNMD